MQKAWLFCLKKVFDGTNTVPMGEQIHPMTILLHYATESTVSSSLTGWMLAVFCPDHSKYWYIMSLHLLVIYQPKPGANTIAQTILKTNGHSLSAVASRGIFARDNGGSDCRLCRAQSLLCVHPAVSTVGSWSIMRYHELTQLHINTNTCLVRSKW